MEAFLKRKDGPSTSGGTGDGPKVAKLVRHLGF